MMDMADAVFGLGIGIMIGFVIGITAGGAITKDDYQEKAIEVQCAGYNVQTGEFEWFKPSDKEKNK